MVLMQHIYRYVYMYMYMYACTCVLISLQGWNHRFFILSNAKLSYYKTDKVSHLYYSCNILFPLIMIFLLAILHYTMHVYTFYVYHGALVISSYLRVPHHFPRTKGTILSVSTSVLSVNYMLVQIYMYVNLIPFVLKGPNMQC